MQESKQTVKKLLIKNMVCNCCCRVLKESLNNLNLEVISVTIGKAEIKYNPHEIKVSSIEEKLKDNGFELIYNKNEEIVEQIKIAVVELVHYYNFSNSLLRNSDFIVEKLGMSYPHLSKIFSENEKVTLEKYIILQKIEKVKQLLITEELTVSEISYQMGYSSVQYLSNQFKREVGMSISEFKRLPNPTLKPINRLTE